MSSILTVAHDFRAEAGNAAFETGFQLIEVFSGSGPVSASGLPYRARLGKRILH
jgi:hypothetical protein